MGKSWGKTSQKSSKKYTNVRKTISPIFIEISAKTLDFTKLHKRFKHISLLDGGDVPLINTGNPNKELLFPKNSTQITFIENGIISKGTYDKVELLDDIKVENNRNVNKFRMVGGFKWT